MATAATTATELQHHVHLHVHRTAAPQEAPDAMDRVKTLVGKILFGLGLALLTASFFTLGGLVIGVIVLETTVVQTLFTCSMMSVIGGYYLANPAKLAGFTLKSELFDADL